MSVTSSENKELLSQILNNHPLKQGNPAGFDQFLLTQVNAIHKDRFRYNNNLTAMNKVIIRNFQNIVVPTQRSTNSRMYGNSKPSWASDGQGRKEAEEVVPKIKIFETRLKEQQDHFNSMIKAEIPKEIDFSDKTEESPIITDNTIDQTMQDRQKELTKIMSGYKKSKEAEAWLKGSGKKPAGQKPDNLTKSPTSIIKTSTKESVGKRVSFQVLEKDQPKVEMDTISLFNKLKIKDNSLEKEPNKEKGSDYTNLLRQIINNQETIIAELRKQSIK
jgi:hypothetical protein